MSRLFACIVCFLGILFFTNTLINISLADGDEHEYNKSHREKKHFEHEDERDLSLVENPTYAENCAGGYYAARLLILQYLNSIKRQASVIALRIETPTYWAALGVWLMIK